MGKSSTYNAQFDEQCIIRSWQRFETVDDGVVRGGESKGDDNWTSARNSGAAALVVKLGVHSNNRCWSRFVFTELLCSI